MNPFYKNLALWLVITLMMVMLYNLFSQQHLNESTLNYSQFLSLVNEDRVAEVVIQGKELYVTDVNRSRFKVYAPPDPELMGLLRQKRVIISAKPESESPWYMSLLVSWFPMLVLIGVRVFCMRQMQSGGGKALSFGTSRARLMTDTSEKVTFADVAGNDEAKEELQEIVDFLKDPKKFTRLGVKAAHARGKGALLFTGHFGYWEINAMAHGAALWPMGVLARPLDNVRLHNLLERMRGCTGNYVIYRRGALRRVLKALCANDGGAILIDQHIQAPDAVTVNFFDRPAATTLALGVLALRTGAPVIPVRTARRRGPLPAEVRASRRSPRRRHARVHPRLHAALH